MVGDLNVRCEMFSRIWKGRVQGHSGSDNPEPQPSFDIKRETGNGGVRLLPTLTWLSPLAWYLKTQVDNKSGVFGQSAGFIELKNLKGVLGVFIRRLRLGGRVASTWPGGWGEWPSLITHFPFFLLFDYKKKKIFSDFCQVCSDFQSVTLLDRFFFFSENLHLFWKTECDPPHPPSDTYKPFPPAWKFTSSEVFVNCYIRNANWSQKKIHSPRRAAMQSVGRAFDWSEAEWETELPEL